MSKEYFRRMIEEERYSLHFPKEIFHDIELVKLAFEQKKADQVWQAQQSLFAIEQASRDRSEQVLKHALWAGRTVPNTLLLSEIAHVHYERFLFICFMIDAVLADIVAVVPEWVNIAESAKNRLVFHVMNARDEDIFIHGDFYHVIFWQNTNLSTPKAFTAEYLSLVHELTHVLVAEEFFEGGTRKFYPEKDQPAPPNSLGGVVHEAVAQMVEQSIIGLYGLYGQKSLIPRYMYRLEFMQHMQAKRGAGLQPNSDLTDRSFRYSEGFEIGLRLFVQGWNVTDVPLLLALLKEIVLERYEGKETIQVTRAIPVDFDENSEYQLIKNELLWRAHK